MKTSDELVTDLTAPEGAGMNNAELQKVADDYLNNLRMQKLFSQWLRPRVSKHNAARAQRAKARIAKHKSKR